MSRATVVYIVMLVACAGGLWAIIGLGKGLRAPTDLSGVWAVGGEDPTVPEQLGESVVIEQSGRFLRLNFAHGLLVDLKLQEDQPAAPEAGKNLDMVFEGPRWKLTAFGSSEQGPLIFRLNGPEKHTFTATRQSEVPEIPEAPEVTDAADGAQGATADAGDAGTRTPAPVAPAPIAPPPDATATAEARLTTETADVGTDAP
jgi:hypothetical protein